MLARYLVLLILGFACTVQAQELDKALMLVAKPEVGAAYRRTVLIAAPSGDGQHVGFIINRQTNRSLASLFPDHAASKKVVDPVYFGGPVMMSTLFVVVRAPKDPGGQSVHLFDNLFVVAREEAVNRIIEKTPNAARYFVGFVGWRPSELEQEVRAGFWHVMAPEPELLFRKEARGMWEELIKRSTGQEPPPEGAPPPRGLQTSFR